MHDAQQGHDILRRLWEVAKPELLAGRKLVVQLKDETRNLDQNAKFHAICEDLSRGKVEWCGKPRSAADWKVLLVSGHSVATKQGHEMLPGLEGEFVNLRESTARMTKARASSLIEYAQAFAAQHEVVSCST
jgi:NinB protein